MKEINLKSDHKTELSIEKRQEKSKWLDEVIIPHRGHTLFQINRDTLEITKAKYSSSTNYNFGKENKREVIKSTNCAYVSALNKKSAMKKYLSGSNGSIKVMDEPLKLSALG